MAFLAPYRSSRPRLHARRDRSLDSRGKRSAAASGPTSKVPCATKKGRVIPAGMLYPTGAWAILNDVILENRYSLRAAAMNLVLSPGPNRFRDYAFVFR